MHCAPRERAELCEALREEYRQCSFGYFSCAKKSTSPAGATPTGMSAVEQRRSSCRVPANLPAKPLWKQTRRAVRQLPPPGRPVANRVGVVQSACSSTVTTMNSRLYPPFTGGGDHCRDSEQHAISNSGEKKSRPRPLLQKRRSTKWPVARSDCVFFFALPACLN